MIDAERPCAYTESQTVLTVCVYHGDRYPCRIRALTAELAEAKREKSNTHAKIIRLTEQSANLEKMRDGVREKLEAALTERDAALASARELQRFNDAHRLERDEARAEAETLRAEYELAQRTYHSGRAHDKTIGFRQCKAGFCDRMNSVLDRPAPASAPKVDEERLMENLKDFKTFDNRMHGKPPAPETAPAPKSDEVEIDYSDVERLANPKIRQDVDWTSGREARRSYESFYGKPAPETGKCTCPPNSLDVLCPLPIKDHGAPAPCKHSWVEEENEADQRQTACQKCGAVCSTGSKDPLHQCGCDPPAPAAENAPTVVWGPECNCWPPTPPHRHGMSNGTMIVEFGPRRGRER